MKILIREVIDYNSSDKDFIAILPDNKEEIIKVLEKHNLFNDELRTKLANGEFIRNYNGCVVHWIESIDEWKL